VPGPAHDLGEVALLVPPTDAARESALGALERELGQVGIVSHRTLLRDDPAGVTRGELAAGSRLLVHCGGLRSLTQVVVPLLDEAGAVLGLYPGGATNDFARTFGLGALTPAAAAQVLASPRTMRVDVGVATVTSGSGEQQVRVLNDAVVGLGADAVRRAGRVPLRQAGRAGALLGWWGAVARYRRPHLDVDMVFAEWHGAASQVRLHNGQFALDGLHVAPQALPDDGAWEVQVWDGPSGLPFTLQPRMRLADHLPNEHISQWRQKRVEITSARPAPVAVDGAYVGTTPVAFELLPGALRLKV
jgi:diacylglycerol kinase (ATP)